MINKTDKKSLSVLYIILLFTLLSGSAFFAWNFVGLLFIINISWLFYQILTKNKFQVLIKDIFIFITSWLLGSLSWMIHLDKGIYAFGICFIFYLSFLLLFICLQKKTSSSPFILIPLWLSVELFFNWIPISFPWLTLGNVLSNQAWLIQWYSILGVQGGSFFLLLIGYYIALFLDKNPKALAIGIIPITIALGMLYISYDTKDYSKEEIQEQCIVVANPKYFPKTKNKERLLSNIIKPIPKDENALLILPELTARGFDNTGFKKTQVYRMLKREIKEGNFSGIILGTTGARKKSLLVNSALYIDNNGETRYKRKDRLVPYTEYLPSIFHSWYSSKGFYGYNFSDDVAHINNKEGIGINICYEAFYPYYIAEQSENVKVLTLLSSERFMNGSKWGKHQYNNIIKLRAIENNRPLVKSAYDGTSMVISPKGAVISASYKPFGFFNVKMALVENATWFSKFGVYTILSIILVLFLVNFLTLSKEI